MWKRIARSKTPHLGCVTEATITALPGHSGYMQVRTTGSGKYLLYVPTRLFKEWAQMLRPWGEKYREEFTIDDGIRVRKWLRAKMVQFRWEVRVNTRDPSVITFGGVVVGLMEGEDATESRLHDLDAEQISQHGQRKIRRNKIASGARRSASKRERSTLQRDFFDRKS